MSNCNTCPSKGNCQKSEDACGITNNPKNKIKHVIGVMSGKGGVGKSSMTTLLAKELNKQGYRVGVMDADITGPSIPRLFGLEKEAAYGSNDAIQPVIWRGPIVGNAVKQFWTDVIWGELDFLLIDMPPGPGDVALTVMQSIPLNGVVMVSTPQPMVSMIVSKAINMCKQANVEVLGIIENMSYVQCPDCGKRIEIFAHKDVEHFLEVNGVELWAELPMMDSVSQIYKDDDFTSEYREQIRSSIAPAVEKLLAKFEK